jgi:mannose-6-phosphate isomerase
MNIDPSGPLLLEPVLDQKPWGGRRLARFGFALPPDEPIGEALITVAEATTSDGRRLGDLIAADPTTWLGQRGLAVTGGRAIFPVLVKIIDAEANLSIQVHPDDATAPRDSLGKTECWHVLDAAPGAVLYVGLRDGVTHADIETACRAGRGAGARFLRTIPAVAGTTILIPAGTVHALGAGVVVYELQQPSVITYRLDDWGRVDAAGNPRQLHLAEGLDVLKHDTRPVLVVPITVPSGAGRRQLLTACRYFALERIALTAGDVIVCDAESVQAFTVLRGGISLATDRGGVELATGATAVTPAATPTVRLRASAPAVALRGWVPDLGVDIVRPARSGLAGEEQIAALAGPLADIRRLLGPSD